MVEVRQQKKKLLGKKKKKNWLRCDLKMILWFEKKMITKQNTFVVVH
jgi:hypothetical protein